MNELEIILNAIGEIKSDISAMKKDISEIKNDISEMKEDLEITRTATNYSGEKLEELTAELKKSNVIA